MGDNGDELNGYTVIKEGDAEILMHTSNIVFFNKAQVNNRDMSIAVLRTFVEKHKEEYVAISRGKVKSETIINEATPSSSPMKETNTVNGEEKIMDFDVTSNGLHREEDHDSVDALDDVSKKISVKGCCGVPKAPKVLEALAASGLRALRYALEVDGLGPVIALDNDEASIKACMRNIKFNGSTACSKVEAYHADARVYMLTNQKEFDVVDLDPYGSPSVFLDSAVQAITDGGILMCTATDMAVLCGGNGEVCYSKYGSYPLKGKYCHELALRILLASIESHANRYKRYIVPILSVQMDFYIRVFVRIFTSASAIKNTPLKLSYVYQCVGCDSFHLQCVGRTVFKNNSVRHAPGFGPVVPQVCSDCGKKFNMGGPIWSAPMHDQEWVLSILENAKAMKERYPAYGKIFAVLTAISEELHDVPLFLSLHNLCGTLKCTSPSAEMFRSAVFNAGYRISGTHVNPLGLKTDAPMEVIWDIMRCWVKSHPVKAQPRDQPGSVILSKEPSLQANFSRAFASLSKAQVKKVARFLPNPERHWGPKVRAGRRISSKHVSLLGPEAINILVGNDKENEIREPAHNHEEQEDGVESKRQKTSHEYFDQ
ncbi:probable tRNA (guanine(26)-N(2))-dimethyltransferase 2 [Phalaenopsis equestris]|uniref:probable tRNA (guanine(26)-N(2))-dimethyltransferase 2 n=1 Tax=Phalaenopsis equestris TaxID=78828 RepID=UPI0009E3E3C4|nr:probable tRNA (guanine(26)-N(2))-dimethyltransferase 2 [Phalaenopsis equestris]